MAFIPVKCTNCGSIMEVDSSKEAAICKSCGEPFITSKALKQFYDQYGAMFGSSSVEIETTESVDDVLNTIQQENIGNDVAKGSADILAAKDEDFAEDPIVGVCRACGNDIFEGDIYCSYCGSKVEQSFDKETIVETIINDCQCADEKPENFEVPELMVIPDFEEIIGEPENMVISDIVDESFVGKDDQADSEDSSIELIEEPESMDIPESIIEDLTHESVQVQDEPESIEQEMINETNESGTSSTSKNNKRKNKKFLFALIPIIVIAVICAAIPLLDNKESSMPMLDNKESSMPTYSSEYKNISDLNGKVIGVEVSNDYEKAIIDDCHDSAIRYYNDSYGLIVALRRNDINAFLVEEPAYNYYHNIFPDLISIPGNIGICNGVVAISGIDKAKSAKLLLELNEFIRTHKTDGKIEKLYNYWTTSLDHNANTAEYTFTGENGNLCIGVRANYYPFSFVNSNEDSGFDIEVIKCFCVEYGYIPVFERVYAAEIIPGVETGLYDLGMGINDMREFAYGDVISDSYYECGISLVVEGKNPAEN